MAFSMAKPWNEGEVLMHHLLRVPAQDNPTSSMLTPQASFMIQRGPLLAIGTLDKQVRPWTTLWGGSTGFSEPLGGNMIGTRTLVDSQNDPVVQALVGDARDGKMLQPQGGKLVSGLAIDLMTRKRVKLAGTMVAGTVADVEVEGDTKQQGSQIQLVTKISESLGNCPKYLNQYDIRPAPVSSQVRHRGPELSDQSRSLISRSDTLFLSTTSTDAMDTNHRGGPPGFVRIISPSQIVYPEYSGNRLYQSLGNLKMNPKIGITFPDFDSGDVLYITGTADVLDGVAAARILPGSNLAVRITIEEARFVSSGLPFRGTKKLPSPYNPLVRTLATEGNIKAAFSAGKGSRQVARLSRKEVITPSIVRLTFIVPDGLGYEPGQWVAMCFKEELDIGYEHMREDDPTSLNDDFIRTFTISSTPMSEGGLEKDFAITVRAVGPATKLLFRQNDRAGFEIPLLGVGGDYKVEQGGQGITPFIAGGVGITPLLGQLSHLDVSPGRLKLIWTVKLADINLVIDVLQRHAALACCTDVFLTGVETSADELEPLSRWREFGLKVTSRRLARGDLEGIEADTWYLCAGKLLKKEVLSWLTGKIVLSEEFDY